jgi:hypothetical protein
VAGRSEKDKNKKLKQIQSELLPPVLMNGLIPHTQDQQLQQSFPSNLGDSNIFLSHVLMM